LDFMRLAMELYGSRCEMSKRDEIITTVACASRPMSPGPLTSVTGGPGPEDHGRHGVHYAPGGAAQAAVTAIMAPAEGSWPPFERDKQE
jgi:hypothetical protein